MITISEYKNNIPCVVGLGTFDGVHIGHTALLEKVRRVAAEFNCQSLVFTFNNHPASVFAPQNIPKVLTTLAQKQRYIEQAGIDILCSVPFTLKMAQYSPEQFVRMLCSNLNVKAIVVGYNYTFGAEAQGTPSTLTALSEKYGYKLFVIPPMTYKGEPVSSTTIRNLISIGELEKANAMLGRAYVITGTVTEGAHLASALGWPTANIKYEENILLPMRGVYATIAHIGELKKFSVTNIGIKPTVDFNGQDMVETHLIGFNGNLYGKDISIDLVKLLRSEIKFEDTNKLSAQMQEDIMLAGAFFAANAGK